MAPNLPLGGDATVTVSTPGPPRITMATPATGASLVPVAGPPGAAGSSSARYTHIQSTPAAAWTVTHNLGAYPTPTVLLDSAPTVPVWTDVEYADANTLVLGFPAPATGRAYL